MKYRGPDYQSFKRYPIPGDRELTLGHARLSIIDLDARSNQPFDYNGWISIVYNGEVYNYEELKARYLKGVVFRTTSDTEVICALYEKFGMKSVELLNGMFAFVIYDKRANELFGARDRLGKKPFYYCWDSDGLEFSSQPEPIHIGRSFEIDQTSRAFYFCNGYIPDPYCIWREVKKLRAGQYFVYDLSENHLSITQYWDLFTNSCGFSRPESYDEAKEIVRELLEDSVRIRLRADVPVGMFLSGGVDSSLTSALIAKQNHDITAYSISFNNADYDESTYAKSVADSLGIPINIRKCEGSDMLAAFDGFSNFYDEPFADFSAIPSSLLAQVTREDVTVAIGGDGGDEIFYGYNNYAKLEKKDMLYTIPWGIRKPLYAMSRLFSDNHYLELLKFKDLRDGVICREGYGSFKKAAKYDVYTLAHQLPDIGYINKERGYLSFSDYDMKYYMNSCINTKTDRATMRYSLELRSPLMDYRLAEYSRLLPLEYLFDKNRGGGKRILKDILYEMVPRELVDRPKHGFAAPGSEWFRTSLREQFIDTLNKNDIEKYCLELDSNKLIEYRDKFLRSEKGTLCHRAFFKVYNYLQWVKSHN